MKIKFPKDVLAVFLVDQEISFNQTLSTYEPPFAKLPAALISAKPDGNSCRSIVSNFLPSVSPPKGIILYQKMEFC